MDSIKFEAHCGDEVWQVEIGNPFGNQQCYYIYIDRYFCGQIVKTMYGLAGYPNERSELTYADMLILIDMIEEAERAQ